MSVKPAWLYRQAGVLAYRDGQVVLISTSSGGWRLPKGVVDRGETTREAAAREAWEEAGIRGLLTDTGVKYSYPKWSGHCTVEVFLLQVTDWAEEWPEQARRQRRLVRPVEAERLLARPELQPLWSLVARAQALLERS